MDKQTVINICALCGSKQEHKQGKGFIQIPYSDNRYRGYLTPSYYAATGNCWKTLVCFGLWPCAGGYIQRCFLITIFHTSVHVCRLDTNADRNTKRSPLSLSRRAKKPDRTFLQGIRERKFPLGYWCCTDTDTHERINSLSLSLMD
jgi:hypothetical protein